jgi:hypothetical protein
MAEPYTEAQAVAALKRLAKRWPQHLTLFSCSGSLAVVDNRDPDYNERGAVTEAATVATIFGIPNGAAATRTLGDGWVSFWWGTAHPLSDR